MLDTTPTSLVTQDGVRLHLEVDGPADAELAVIFIHGFTLNLANFSLQRESLSGEPYRRLFYDQRSFGQSEPGSGMASIRRLAADLGEIIDATPGTVVLVGHSMGGMTIQSLAAERPELFGAKVRGTVLVATASSGADLDVFGLAGVLEPIAGTVLRSLERVRPLLQRVAGRKPLDLVAWLFHDLRSTKEHRRAFVDMVELTPFDVMAHYLDAMYAYDEVDMIATIGAVPTIVIAGEHDRVTPVSANLRVAQAIPGARLIVASRAGHMVPFERSEVVDSAIRAIVARAATA